MRNKIEHASVSWRAVFKSDKFNSADGDLRVIDATTTDHPQGPLTLATINLRAFAPHVEPALDVARAMANAPQLLNACINAAELLEQIQFLSRESNDGIVKELTRDALVPLRNAISAATKGALKP